jgi:hypothetical protein
VTLSFDDWFAEFGTDLWSILKATSDGSPEEVEEDFVQVLESTRSRWSKLSSAGAANNEFFKECLKRGLNRRNPEWVSQVLYEASLGLGWSLDSLSNAFGLTGSAVRYRIYDFFRRSHHGEMPHKTARRECLRFDLFAIDWMLGSVPSNEAGVISPTLIERHLKSCVRCQTVAARLKSDTLKLKKTARQSMPVALLEWQQSRVEIKRGPRWTAMPVQASVLALLIVVVLLVPKAKQQVTAWMSTVNKPVVESAKIEVKPPAELESQVVDLSPIPGLSFELPKAEVYFVPEPSVPMAGVDWSWSQMVAPPSEAKVAVVAPPKVVDPEVAQAPSVVKEVIKPTIVVAAPPIQPPAPVAVAQPPAAPKPSMPAGQKVFYRWGAFSTKFDEHRSLLLEALTKYRAQTAGDLPLGADHLGGIYFHFSVDESVYDQLIADIEKLGLIEFSRSQAESNRLTPPGKRRVVFLVRPKS